MEEKEIGYESTRKEEERGSKGLRNNTNFHKSHHLHIFPMFLIKDPNNQSVNVGSGLWGSFPSLDMRAWD